MTTLRRGLVAGVLGVLVLTGCGDDDAADDAAGESGVEGVEDVEVTDGGTYVGELADGSRLEVRLDVPADDPAVAPFEELRATTGAEEPTWIVAEITPPDDVEGTGRFLTFIEDGADPLDDDPADDTDGVTNAEFACAVIEDWFGQATVKDEALNDAYMAVYDGPCGGQSLQVLAPGGETTTYVLVYDGELPGFETIQPEMGTRLSPA